MPLHPSTSLSLSNSPMTHASSSGPTTEQLHTITDPTPDHSFNSSLSSLSDDDPVSNHIKRAHDSSSPISKPAKKPKTTDEPAERGIYCHQCRTQRELHDVLRCTHLKVFSKHGQHRACNLAWCERDLIERYGIQPEAIRAAGPPSAKEKELHSSFSYMFTCPCCEDKCQNSICRKKKRLQSLGAAKPHTSKHLDSSTFDINQSDSDLSDPSSENKKPTPAQSSKAPSSKPKKQKSDSKKQDSKSRKQKSHIQTSKNKKVDSKPKPGNRKGPVVEPPTFEKVDTRLSWSEAEQRIGLREFLVRFRVVLSIPERSLAMLDDFDRPLTEAGVRLFAGAMLDPIKEEFEDDDEFSNTLFNFREELRYYADLARFAAIYDTLKSLLHLFPPRIPPSVSPNAIDLVLSMNHADAVPDWLLDSAPPRRRGASRLPQPNEIIEMLLAMADRATQTPRLRTEMDSTSGENEARRHHASEAKNENTRWDSRKKQLAAALVRCRSASETKAKQKESTQAQQEHILSLSLLNVNLRATLSRRAFRQEPLGVDRDGRVYYALTPRPVDEDSRPPVGWGSGLLVWGIGIPNRPEDELPWQVSRWSHFGKSQAVKRLARWIEWKVESTRKAASKKPKPKPHENTTSASIKPSSSFENVIPISVKKAAARSESSLSSVDSDSSDLSSVPDSTELLSMLPTAEYKSQPAVIEESCRELVRRLHDVAEWLEVLEWKGLGEL